MPTFLSSFGKAKKPMPRKNSVVSYDDEVEKSLRNAKLLGSGGFAKVYRVRRSNGDYEALKVIHLRKYVESAHIPIKDVVERLDRLCQMLRDDPCPNIVQYIGWSAPRDDLYIRIELCSSRDLFARVTESEEGHLSEDDAADVAKGLCNAVAYLHEHGWVHRDIKPENIFMPRDENASYNQCLLGDLGCALDRIGPDEWFHGSAGSTGYLSPEMALGEPWSLSTDLFSVGVTMYECLSGRSPIVCDDPKIAFARAVPFPARYWGVLSADAKDFVSLLLEYDPDKRMRAEEALFHPWVHGSPDRRPSAQSTNSTDSNMSWTEAPGPTRPAMRKDKLSTYFSKVSQHVKIVEDLDRLRLSPLASDESSKQLGRKDSLLSAAESVMTGDGSAMSPTIAVS